MLSWCWKPIASSRIRIKNIASDKTGASLLKFCNSKRCIICYILLLNKIMKDNEKFIENNNDYEEIIYIAKIRDVGKLGVIWFIEIIF